MRTRTNTIALLLTTLGVAAAVACGSTPKAEPDVPAPPPPPTAPADTSEKAADAPTATAPDAGAADPAAGKAAECAKHLGEAQSEMDAELIKVDTVCKKDADCMKVKGHACDFTCVTAAIPKAEEKEWTREMTAMNAGACKKWTELECGKEATAPTCADDAKKIACRKGHCVLE